MKIKLLLNKVVEGKKTRSIRRENRQINIRTRKLIEKSNN